MGRDGFGVYCRDDDAGIGDPGGESAVTSDDTANLSSNLPGKLQRADQIGADIALRIAAADRENANCILLLPKNTTSALFRLLMVSGSRS